MRVIVHGGAGDAPADPEPRHETLDEAAATAAAEDDPLDAVETAVRALESDGRFNAGVGGAVQSDGFVRTDAGVMTSDRQAGAAASMPGVEHAVTVARHVMADTPHVLLAGVHAVDFAAAVGVETEVDLLTDATRERWESVDAPPVGSPSEHLAWVRERFGGQSATLGDHDTVGAVAVDGGSIGDGPAFATATSTGGRWFALAGRVGDVPQIGSGFYASPAGAASATGAGEAIAKTTLARRTVGYLEAGDDAASATARAVEDLAELTGERAGVIALDRDGTVGEATNAAVMQTANARTQ